jgi:histidinol-phosphatase (PHP family)
MAVKYNPRFVIGCDAHTPEIVRRPEHIKGFEDFLKRNGIECGDNIIEIP